MFPLSSAPVGGQPMCPVSKFDAGRVNPLKIGQVTRVTTRVVLTGIPEIIVCRFLEDETIADNR